MEIDGQQTRLGEIAADWNTVPLADLIAHLISQHHEYLRIELPALEQRLSSVCEACRAQGSPELAALPGLLFLMKGDLDLHMRKEELALFPAIENLEQPERAVGCQHLTSAGLSTPIRTMISEHDSASGTLDDIRRITRDYRLPLDASETYRALFQEFETLERGLRLHMYLEETILFPRALSLIRTDGVQLSGGRL